MDRGRMLVAGFALLPIPLFAVLATASTRVPQPTYRDGPPPGFSGGFGEPGCDGCHFGGPVDDGVGKLTIDGIGDSYTPGASYSISVSLTRPGMKLAGFQITTRFAANGDQAGELVVGPSHDQAIGITVDRNVQYLFQRANGATPVGDSLRWTFRWTAPASGGTILVSASANAANGDDATSGDYVYRLSRTLSPSAPGTPPNP